MNNDITLTDLFEVEMLQRIQDAFAKMTGMAAIITDADGIPVTKGTNFSDFCSKYVRPSPIGEMRCRECDRHGAELALKVGSSVSYYCHAGLLDFAAPIMAGDKLIGCFVGGQVLTTPPDIPKLMEVASDLDLNLITYLQSAMAIRLVPKATLDNASYFLYTLTDTLSSIAYHKYIMKEANIEIEKAANLKSDFLANMSHELRTPMNAVIGMAEMALREDLSPSARNYINQIKNSGKTLLTIINDILDFSKIESGKMDILEVNYEPVSLIRDISSIMNTRIDRDNVEFVLDINPALPKQLFGDSIRIKQVIINLANNAAKFTRKGQVYLKFDFRQTGSKTIDLLFSVKDTGIGIRKEDMVKIFQSFQQVDSKRNRSIEGTGLGLAICKQLLSLMDGNIKVESVYGEGSSFSFVLPQKIVDPSASISLTDPDPLPTYGFLKNDYAHRQLRLDMARLNIKYMDLKNINITKFLSKNESSGNGAYLFIDYKNFDMELQLFIKEHPKITAVVVTEYDTLAHFDIPNVIVASKPLSSMSIASIYNHEAMLLDEHQSTDEYYDFTAESACVLIVDDNQINLTVAEGLLEPLKMHVDTASGGEEALKKITEKKYDLILMDHMMPELDGVETTRIIRNSHHEYDNVPIIALTANVVSGASEMFKKEGMNDFVPKPIEVRVLLTKLKRWLPKEKVKSVTSKHGKSSSKPQQSSLKIKDLDTESALKLAGSENLYWTILKDYFQAIPKKYKLIQTCWENADWRNYTVEVHALKSASRQIGAAELSALAAKLEEAGNALDIDTINSKTDEVLEMYAHYYDILQPYFSESNKNGSNGDTISSEELEDTFKKIEHAVDNLNLEEMEASLKMLEGYSFDGDEANLYSSLCEAVAEMDPDACVDIITKWRALRN